MNQNQDDRTLVPFRPEDFGHYLVMILQDKGYSLSWLMNHPQRDTMIRHIESVFERQYPHLRRSMGHSSIEYGKNQGKEASC